MDVTKPNLIVRFVALHKRACERGERNYIDPATGFIVLTEVAHTARGTCCGGACRHCPYDWANVDPERFEGFDEARTLRRKRRQQGGL